MKRIFLFISLTALAVLQCNGLSAQSGLFYQANEAYQQGNYQQATELYEQCIAQSPSADAYYNLGNAYFKQGELSQSIIAYERSLRLNPRNKDCKHNLAFAKTQIIDNVEDNTFLLSAWATAIRNQLSLRTWLALSIAFWCLCLIALVLFASFNHSAKRFNSSFHHFINTSFHIAWIALLFAITTGLNASSLNRRDSLRQEAIITQGIVNAKASPDRSGTDLFTLHEGTKVTIHETLGDWSNIHVGNNVGWIPTSNLERI